MSWAAIAVHMLNTSGRKMTSGNFGMEGKGAVFYLRRLAVLLADATWTPSVIVIQPFTLNDTFSVGAINTAITEAVRLASIARARGIEVIFTTVAPMNTTDATTDGNRKTGNTQVRNAGGNVLDIDDLATDGATPARIIGALSWDGIHFKRDFNYQIGAELVKVINKLPNVF